MKKNFFKHISLFFLAALFITGCRKETTEATALNEETASSSMENRSGNGGDCRVTKYDFYNSADGYYQVDYFSYKNGLVDEWLASYGNLFKMQYDRDKKLKIARMYDGETLINTIKFIYKNDKVVKEIWYEGNTNQVGDEVTNTYNRKGEMIRSESIIYDLYVLNTYTDKGELKSWQLFISGLPNAKAEYTYRNDFKNPLNTRPGIDYSFVYINSAFGTGDKWPSSEKFTNYDEEGNPSVYYDQDPRRTTGQLGFKKYPLQINYFDKLTSNSMINTFEYENCSGHHEDSPAGSLSQKQGINKSNAPAANFKSLMHSSQSGIMQKMKRQLVN